MPSGATSESTPAPRPGAVSAVLAAYNEGPTVARVVEALRAAVPGLLEIFVVDDGSTDDTSDRARAAGAEVIRLPSNRGKGYALRAGFEAARGELLLTIDADGQDDPAEVRRLFAALEPDVAMVIGSRFLGRFEAGAINPINRIGNRGLTWLFDRLYGAHLTDTQAGFRLFRRASVAPASLRARAYEIETELTARVLRAGGRVREVGVTRRPRAAGTTAFRRVRHGLRIVATMLRVRFTR